MTAVLISVKIALLDQPIFVVSRLYTTSDSYCAPTPAKKFLLSLRNSQLFKGSFNASRHIDPKNYAGPRLALHNNEYHKDRAG